MPPLEGDENIDGKGIKILTSNKLLTRLSVLLAQIKAVNNSFKLKIIKKINLKNTAPFVTA